jgi:CBS domain-containing protein
MKLNKIMTRDVQVVRPTDTLQTAALKMRGHDIGMLPICEDDRLVGVVTDRDIAIRAAAEGLDPKAATCAEVKSDGVVCCYEDESVDEAARVMKAKQIRCLLVLDRDDKRLVGVVALGDVATNGTAKLSGEILESVSEPPGQL